MLLEWMGPDLGLEMLQKQLLPAVLQGLVRQPQDCFAEPHLSQALQAWYWLRSGAARQVQQLQVTACQQLLKQMVALMLQPLVAGQTWV